MTKSTTSGVAAHSSPQSFSTANPVPHTVGVHEAKTQLSRLLREVEAGGEVHIQRGGTLVARLIGAGSSAPRQLGTDVGLLWIADDFDAEDTIISDAFEATDAVSA